MKYSIAKSQIKSSKLNARRSYDSSRHYGYSSGGVETGCTKINQMIQCVYNIVSNYTNRVKIIYDAPTDILDITVKHNNNNIQYKLEFHLIVDDDKLGYNIKVDNINWTKVVKDAKLFNPCIAAQGDTLTVADTNHAELKLIVNAVKRHYAKYNLCQHYENYTGQAVNAESDFEIKDDLINEIHKHAKCAVTNRVNALIKKFKIKSDILASRDTYIYGESRYATKPSDGKLICNIAVQPILSHTATSKRHIAPTFYFAYYVNMKNGKITWRFCDELFNSIEWGYRVSCSAKDDEIFFDMNMYRLKDIDLKAHPNSYEDWYKKYACVEFIENEIKKVLAAVNVKAFI